MALVLIPGDGAAEVEHWNDTVVDTPLSMEGRDVQLDGNLTIAPTGTLKLSNCTLFINTTPHGGRVTIAIRPGGSLLLTNVSVATLSDLIDYALFAEGMLAVRESAAQGPSTKTVMFPRSGIQVGAGGHVELSSVSNNRQRYIDCLVNLTLGGSCDLDDCVLGSDGTAIIAGDGAHIAIKECDIRTVSSGDGPGGPFMDLSSGATIRASDSTIGAYYQGTALVARGPSTEARFENCTLSRWDLANLSNCDFYFEGQLYGAFRSPRVGPWTDVRAVDSKAQFVNVRLGGLDVLNGSLDLVNSTYGGGSVRGMATVLVYGWHPPAGTLAATVTLHMHHRADFQLLNETRAPTEGLFLVVETRDGVEVADTVSGEGGWVRGVWLRSWTRRGDLFSYEPPHRVEFGDVDFSITTVQVFGNATVVLWNSVDQRDLSLVPDGVDITDRSPREGDPFDVVVDGRRLVPYAYDGGTANLTLSVDGRPVQTQALDLRARRDVTFRALNLTEGLHELSVVVDPGDAVAELNEGGNDEVRVIVEVASRNYTGFEVDLYVRILRMVDTAGGDEEPLEPGVVQVECAVRARYSQTIVRNVKVSVYINGVEWNSAWVDLPRPQDGEYAGSARLPINLPAGTYEIEVRVDPSGELDERYENNNADSRSVRVEEPPVEPFLDLWDQPLLCLAMGIVGVVAVAYVYRRARGPAAPLPPPASPPPPSAREMRTELVGYTCPQCGRGRLTGYADGSALCQDCKSVIAPRK